MRLPCNVGTSSVSFLTFLLYFPMQHAPSRGRACRIRSAVSEAGARARARGLLAATQPCGAGAGLPRFRPATTLPSLRDLGESLGLCPRF